MPSERGIAFITGGGRGIGASIARELAADGWSIVVAARTLDQVEAVAEEVGGRAVELDVTDREAVERAVAEAGDVELLVANAGIGGHHGSTWEVDPEDWWRVLEVNILGVHLCCRAVIPGMLERGSGRIVITGSGAAYLPGASNTSYTSSKAAVCRYGETLANELQGRIPVFFFSPGLVQTEMTTSFGDDMPWTPPELAPQLVRVLASGRADELAGRYIHAEHDDIEDLIGRADEIIEQDLNAIRLQR
jgi:NAD(P)-dependent dehydrogenase (short-subunit alcohol dehydrogenase family)